jgi:hypothetical protein
MTHERAFARLGARDGSAQDLEAPHALADSRVAQAKGSFRTARCDEDEADDPRHRTSHVPGGQKWG